MTPQEIKTIKTLVEHAKETYPHFESPRGQRDIAAVEALLPGENIAAGNLRRFKVAGKRNSNGR